MNEILSSSIRNLLTPMILFFLLGLVAGRLRTGLTIPEPIGKAMSLYLLVAIGFKGGAQLSQHQADPAIAVSALTAVALSFTLPFVAYGLLRATTRLDRVNRAAVAAHYGSVSVVTFAAASALLTERGVFFEPYLVAMLALMETPAIVSGLLLAGRGPAQSAGGLPGGSLTLAGELRRALFGGCVVLLLGSFGIGWATGTTGMMDLEPLLVGPFKGALCFFLLDMGLNTARSLADVGRMGPRLIAFGIGMPLVGATVGLASASLLGLSAGGAMLLAVLAASASYIVVPAALREALPQASPAIYMTLALGITFPFNLVVGLPLYEFAARALAGGA